MSRVKEMTSDMSAEADFLTLRGLLAVESGEVGRGRDYLRQALSVWGGEDEARGGGGLDFGARVIAQDTLQASSVRGPAGDEGKGP